MKTSTIGELLSLERKKHKLSLEEVAQKTRIRLEYLQALENNQFVDLPAGVFVKGYIKTYAGLLGFDSQPLIALLRRDYKESAKGKLIPREFVKKRTQTERYLQPVSLVLFALAGFFIILSAYVFVQWYNLQKPPSLRITAPDNDSFVSAQVKVTGVTSSEAMVMVNANPVSLQANGTFTTEVYLPREGLNTITVEATDSRGKTSLVQRTVYVRF